MQLARGIGAAGAALALTSAWAGPGVAFTGTDEQALDTMFRYFNDSEHVTVRSSVADYNFALGGDLAVKLHWNNERVTVPAIDALPGTQQAVDAITTASRPISGNAFQDFIKTRNEFEGGVTRGGAAVGYYVSTESDYLGQQLSASYNRDLMDQLVNLSFGTSFGWDAIDPLADDDTQSAADHKTTLHANVVATRVVTATTLVRLGLEYNRVDGLQHNPYRNVYAGGGPQPERHPELRQRRDAFLKLHQYLPHQSSLKGHYRLYSDDWGILSHELSGSLSQYVTRGLFASWEYRWYTQSAADFYRDEYLSANGIDGYRSGDYRMAPLASHLFGVTLDVDLGALAEDTPVLRRMRAWCNLERYFNNNNYTANMLETGLSYRF